MPNICHTLKSKTHWDTALHYIRRCWHYGRDRQPDPTRRIGTDGIPPFPFRASGPDFRPFLLNFFSLSISEATLQSQRLTYIIFRHFKWVLSTHFWVMSPYTYTNFTWAYGIVKDQILNFRTPQNVINRSQRSFLKCSTCSFAFWSLVTWIVDSH